MIYLKYFFLSALSGGVIGGVLGAMLTLKIFGDQGPDQSASKLTRMRRKIEIEEPPTWGNSKRRSWYNPGKSLSNTITYLKFESY